jgi:formamidopyrimidine-DNA glycosylase
VDALLRAVATTFKISEYRCDAVADEKVFEGVTALDFSKRMTGSKILAAHRKGKQLWLELDTRPWPCFHLGMSGSFAAITATNEIKCASYVNTKIAVSTELWPPKFWKFTLTMSNCDRVAFIAVSPLPHF